MKILLREAEHEAAAAAWDESSEVLSAAVTYPEARAAIAAAARAGRVDEKGLARVREALEDRWSELTVLEVTEELARVAGELAEFHALRGYDAVHLTVAVAHTELVATWDRALAVAARREGLAVAP